MHSTTSAVDFSKETLVVKEDETYDAGVFERAEASGSGEVTEGAPITGGATEGFSRVPADGFLLQFLN